MTNKIVGSFFAFFIAMCAACGGRESGGPVGPDTGDEFCAEHSLSELDEGFICDPRNSTLCAFDSSHKSVQIDIKGDPINWVCTCEHPGKFQCSAFNLQYDSATDAPGYAAELCEAGRSVFSSGTEPSPNPGGCIPVPEIPGYPETRAVYWCC